MSKLPPHTEMLDLSHNDIGLKGLSAMANCFQKKCLDSNLFMGNTMDGFRSDPWKGLQSGFEETHEHTQRKRHTYKKSS